MQQVFICCCGKVYGDIGEEEVRDKDRETTSNYISVPLGLQLLTVWTSNCVFEI